MSAKRKESLSIIPSKKINNIALKTECNDSNYFKIKTNVPSNYFSFPIIVYILLILLSQNIVSSIKYFFLNKPNSYELIDHYALLGIFIINIIPSSSYFANFEFLNGIDYHYLYFSKISFYFVTFSSNIWLLFLYLIERFIIISTLIESRKEKRRYLVYLRKDSINNLPFNENGIFK